VAGIDLPHRWSPRPYQQAAWDSWLGGCNRQLLVWHRRAGKDELNLRMHSVGAFNRVGTYWHMLPEYTQARKAIWDAVNPHTGRRRIEEAFPSEIIASRRDTDMFIRFKNGSTWQVVGSDNFDSLVGTPPVGLTASEWALADPRAWAYLSPILAENGGWASFITTPRGNNHVKTMRDRFQSDPRWFVQVLTAADTGAVSEQAIADQRAEYESLFGQEMAEMLVEQEFFCSFAGALVGSYWGADVSRAEREGRIRPVAVDPTQPVHTAWDLGAPANNPIWCFQVVGNRPHVVDFYRPKSEDLEDWCRWLNERGYHGRDYVPHDIFHGSWGVGRTRIQMMQSFGRKPVPVKKVSVAEGLTAGRETLKVCVIDDGTHSEARTVEGLDGLRSYRREWDDDLKRFRDIPVKDWAEHIGSAFRYLGLAWREMKVAPPPPKPVFEVEADPATGFIQVQAGDMVKRYLARRAREDG
jgi:phage terminase large subunit